MTFDDLDSNEFGDEFGDEFSDDFGDLEVNGTPPPEESSNRTFCGIHRMHGSLRVMVCS